MNDWASILSLGLVHPAAFPEALAGQGSVLDTVRKIVEDPFFSAIEVTWIRDAKVRDRVASLLRTGDMDVVYLASVPILLQRLDLGSVYEESRREAVSALKPLIDEAYALGARLFLVGSGPDPGPGYRDAAKAQLMKSLGELCAYAEEVSDTPLIVTLENYDRDVDKRFLIGPTREAVEVARLIRKEHPNFGLTIDESHLCQLREDAGQELPDAIDVVVHVHLANCVLDSNLPGYGDQHPRFGVPGSEVGAEEMASFLLALDHAGHFRKRLPTRLPVVSLEVKPQGGEESLAVVANAKRAFMRAWARYSSKQGSPKQGSPPCRALPDTKADGTVELP